ncbi:mavicyanin-like [Magnolia sinica]|uniref:mavicyanin-like n=1 Tax=Magnolia sinica TaxID=86752 RepID=UPI002658E3E6|nr:mavicyanin-like [Magnolia sinica]
MASSFLSLFLLSAVGCVLIGSAIATEHQVGDKAGWTLPPNPSFYEEWAKTKKFVVGDVLVFEYKTSVHNVLEVTKDDFDSCTQFKPIAMYYKSPTKITLKEPGQHFFYCGVGIHCEGAQKLVINVE